MTLVALHDSETNGLLRPQVGKTQATKMHSLGFKIGDAWWSCCDEPAFQGRWGETLDVLLPSGNFLRNVYHASIADGLRELEKADLLVGHNSQDFDERIYRKFHPWWKPKGRTMDTLILSRLLYPVISKQGPNTHKVPGNMRVRHSIEAWGYRLGEKKNKGFDPGDWQTWSEDMQLYMLQDVVCLEKLFKWLMSRKPAPLAVEIEHDFAAVIRRQEAWGFTFDYEKALKLAADTEEKIRLLEGELVDTFGEWWEPGKVTRRAASSKVKLTGYPDVTLPRFSPTSPGKRLAKDYVGPPRCHYEAGAPFTPIERVEFNPGSRAHVHKMLVQRYGWKPTKMTDKGAVQVDDEVLRELPYPECPKLADYYAAKKIHGYVSEGKKAWLSVAHEEPDAWRMHGSMNTIGTYTYRGSHMDPNMGQIPTRDPEYGHRCRELFTARRKFLLIGADGSGMQLRLLAHYLHKWDRGTYAGVFERDEDPHAFMRDSIGVDLMGEGNEGRSRGKTLNYALCFGGGERKLGSIIEPRATDARKIALGKVVKERMLPVFGTAFDELKAALKDAVETNGAIRGLDGRMAKVFKVHAALATLLQMGEGVVMKDALVIFDRSLQAHGLRPGVDGAGVPHPETADYEFCANVHDEYQADVLPQHEALYTQLAQRAVPEAGRHLGLKCPLKSDVKAGPNWVSTH